MKHKTKKHFHKKSHTKRHKHKRTYKKRGGYNMKAAYPLMDSNTKQTMEWINPSRLYSAMPANGANGMRGGCNCGVPTLPTFKGGCNCDVPTLPTFKGGCGPTNNMNWGAKKGGCNCGMPDFIKGIGGKKKGGDGSRIYVPNGLAGEPWTGDIKNWPGIDGVVGNHNYLKLNTYDTDISRQTQAIGANYPYNGGKKRKHKGGTFTNSFAQDFINLNRSIAYNVNNAYNTLSGKVAPVNPLPWKDQYTK